MVNQLNEGKRTTHAILGIDFSQNAQLVSALAIHDTITATETHYPTIKSRFFLVRNTLIPTP